MISVILNVYKRPHTLQQQIEAILNQSVKISPENIHVWYNYSGMQQEYPHVDKIKTYRCNWNTKFFGRFTIPLLCTTPYVVIFDDDNIPGRNWFKNCLDSMGKENGIMGGAGIIVRRKSYMPHVKIGWNGRHHNETRRVDLVGHAWFFRQEWTKYMWYEKPYSWDNAEDIMFAYLCQKHGGVNTFVPPHPEDDLSLWCTDPGEGRRLGRDSNATWKKGGHREIRDNAVAYCIENGWKTVNMNR